MKKIDIEKIDELKDILDEFKDSNASLIDVLAVLTNKILTNIKDGNAVILNEGKEEKYAIINMSDYSLFQELLESDRQFNPFKYGQPEIRVVSDDDIEVSYEEYENIKKQLLEALDRTFKPKLEKLN